MMRHLNLAMAMAALAASDDACGPILEPAFKRTPAPPEPPEASPVIVAAPKQDGRYTGEALRAMRGSKIPRRLRKE